MGKLLHISGLLLFGMIVMSTGCHSPTPSGPPAPKKIPSLSNSGLTGSWQWIYSVAPGVYTPNKSGYTLNIKFTADSLFSYFRNDTLIETARYHIFLGDSTEYYPWQITFQNISLTKFNRNFGAFGEASSIALNGDTLAIEANTTDSYKDVYVLIQ